MKYIKRCAPVEAEQYIKGKIIDGVDEHKGCGYRMCDICGGGNPTETVVTLKIPGSRLYLKEGDWIITDAMGRKDMLSHEQFVRDYTIYVE